MITRREFGVSLKTARKLKLTISGEALTRAIGLSSDFRSEDGEPRTAPRRGTDRGGRRCGAAPIFRSDFLFQDQLASVLRADDLPILTAIHIPLHLRLVVAVRLL